MASSAFSRGWSSCPSSKGAPAPSPWPAAVSAMSDLRHDPIQKRWVIIAPERGRRPLEFQTPAMEQKEVFCPFCPTHEATTPPEIQALRHNTWPNQPGWEVRVVPNKFPALRIEGELDRKGVGIFDRMAGVGAHE